jgi:NADH-quinone oxidoreductase subunit K
MRLEPTVIVGLTALALMAIGLYGLAILRNLIKLVIALQLLTKSALLALLFAATWVGQGSLGQALMLTVILADTVVAVMAMALAVQIKRCLGSLDLSRLSSLRG